MSLSIHVHSQEKTSKIVQITKLSIFKYCAREKSTGKTDINFSSEAHEIHESSNAELNSPAKRISQVT